MEGRGERIQWTIDVDKTALKEDKDAEDKSRHACGGRRVR